MTMGKRGLTLLEIVIASAIMAFSSVVFFKFMASSKRISQGTTYDYTAVNILRDLLEWGSSITFAHAFQQKYQYYGATNAEGATYALWNVCSSRGTSNSTGYAKKIWTYFYGPNYGPFDMLGDIGPLTKNLVPIAAPYSVKIYYETAPNPAFYNAFQQYVKIYWQDVPDGPVRSRELSLIALSHVNDQLHLELAEFDWEQE
ncbi:MAG: hypothetical protein PHW69_06535 [Elusimicrobiaceae bacterium]|nr:hypothetical protein [Elusimicrobiaceae bacterium]